MPAPILAWFGIAAIIKGLSYIIMGIVAGITAFFAKYFAKKAAFAFTLLTLFAALSASFFYGLKLLFEQVVIPAVPPELPIALSWVLPANIDEVMSVYITVKIFEWVYDWKKYAILELKNG